MQAFFFYSCAYVQCSYCLLDFTARFVSFFYRSLRVALAAEILSWCRQLRLCVHGVAMKSPGVQSECISCSVEIEVEALKTCPLPHGSSRQ